MRPEATRATFAALTLLFTLLLSAGCGGSEEEADRPERGGDAAPQTTRPASTGERTAAERTAETAGRGPEEAAEELSLREAVGQMFIVSVDGTGVGPYTESAVRERNVGGVILFEANMRSEAQVRSLTGSLQEIASESQPGIPLLAATDQEGGIVSNAPWVSPQPPAAEVGASGQPEQARRIAETMGEQLLRAGVNADFAPVVDTGGGAAIGSRSYGDDPELVARMGAAAVEGFEEAGVISAAKHFPNHGPATADSHTALPVVEHDMTTVRDYDLPPFAAAVDAGVPMVMASHLVYPAIDPERPVSLSPRALGMLREDLGFDGVIVTDDLSMEAATRGGTIADAAVRAAGAGADAMIVSGAASQQAAAQEAVIRAVESGELPRERVYEAAGRVIEMKREYDLYRGSG